MLVDITLLIGLSIGDDATCHGSSYLAYQDVLTVGRSNHDVRMFVLLAGLGQPGLVVVAVLVVHELDLAIDREPVGMNIQRTHEDANHKTLVMEILILFGFLNNYNLAVGRCYY